MKQYPIKLPNGGEIWHSRNKDIASLHAAFKDIKHWFKSCVVCEARPIVGVAVQIEQYYYCFNCLLNRARLTGAATVCPCPDHRELSLTLPMREWERVKPLGRGTFGSVYLVKHRKQLAACKLIPGLDKESFFTELDVLRALSGHRNILQLVGFEANKTRTSQQYILLVEFMENGSLEDTIVFKRGPRLSYLHKLQIAIDISNGLAFMHSRDIFHQDLHEGNVLLDKNLRAKIGDFGLALFKPHNFAESRKKDVFDLLLLIYEKLFSGRVVNKYGDNVYFVKRANIFSHVLEGLFQTLPHTNKIHSLLKWFQRRIIRRIAKCSTPFKHAYIFQCKRLGLKNLKCVDYNK